ncbi:MAG: SAM hydrolase/SAM-dependent halogenase family protein [Planctomycetota bacterium]
MGTERKAIAVKTEKYYFVGPDNGLVWEAAAEQKIIKIRELAVPADASRTFHGRDVFARAAAKIDLGEFDETGEPIEQIERMELYQKGREGIVVRIDRFGNVITNLGKLEKDEYGVETGGKRYTMRYYPNYYAAKEDELFLIEGSCRTLEISLKGGSANDKLRLKTGERIKIS